MKRKFGGITEVKGVKVGHYTDRDAATGVTVILTEEGARAAVEVRGAAPGTRETDLLQPSRLVEKVQAIVLAGGSAFGLDAAGGVMRYLEERGKGYPIGPLPVPIVPAAILFDLFIGRSDVRPDAGMGYQACLNATAGPVAEGSVGAGTGATVGKIFGPLQAVKSGLGSASCCCGNLIMAALVVVNAFGDIYSREGELIAGPRHPQTGLMESTVDLMLDHSGPNFPGNTTLGVVVTNGLFHREALGKIAQMAHNGLARSIWPVHTMWDGDIIFSLSMGEQRADLSLAGTMAAEAVAGAVERAVRTATSLCGIPSIDNL